MPAVLRKLFHFFLGYSWLVCLLGLGLMAQIGYSVWKADGHAYRERSQLTAVAGEVTQASQVTETRTSRRRGTSSSKTYYELTVAGHAKALRIDTTTLRQDYVAALIDEPISALVDPGDDSRVYELALQNGPTLIRYEYISDRLQSDAQAIAKTWNRIDTWLGALFLTLLGGAGFWLKRRLRG